MNYDDMRAWQLAEQGDDRPRSHVFIPGVDFDPDDAFDVEAMLLVGERDLAESADYWKRRALAAEGALED